MIYLEVQGPEEIDHEHSSCLASQCSVHVVKKRMSIIVY
jgi:hypothetical protein